MIFEIMRTDKIAINPMVLAEDGSELNDEAAGEIQLRAEEALSWHSRYILTGETAGDVFAKRRVK